MIESTFDKRAFAAKLRGLREAAKLTQVELAERAGVSVSVIVKWEAGKSEPTFGNVIAMADVFGVSLDRLRPPKGKPDARGKAPARP